MVIGTPLKAFFLSCLMLIGSAHAQDGIQFETGTWSQVKEKAQQEKKVIFVDVYTSWCIPCKKMTKEVFILPEVGTRFNKDFINFKIDAEKGEGIELAKQYKVGSYPTYLFVNPDGTLVYRSVGSMSAEKFLGEARLALSEAADPKPLAGWEDGYLTQKTDTAFVWAYFQKRKRLGLDNADIVDQYASLLTREQLLQKGMIMKILQVQRLNADGPLLKFISENRAAVKESLEPSLKLKLDDHLALLVGNDVERAIRDRDEEMLAGIVSFLMKSPSGEFPAEWKAREAQLKYFGQTQETDSLRKVFNTYARSALSFDPSGAIRADSIALAQFEADLAAGKINIKPENLEITRRSRGSSKQTSLSYRIRDIARAAYHGLDDKASLDKAMELIEMALRLSDNFTVHEIKAGLLYKSGQKAAGIDWMKKTIENFAEMTRQLNLESEKNKSRLNETLKKMQEGKQTWGY
jgi:thiol-disulfide isomerase/thioredoxin